MVCQNSKLKLQGEMDMLKNKENYLFVMLTLAIVSLIVTVAIGLLFYQNVSQTDTPDGSVLTTKEAMLDYINEKYSCDAEFVSFESEENSNRYNMTVKIGDYTVNIVATVINGKLTYKDDYANQVLATPYNAEINKYFTDNSIKAVAYTEIEDVNGSLDEIISTDGNKEERDTLLGSVTASNYVFVQGIQTQDDLKKVAENYANWYQPNLKNSSNVTRFYLVDNITSITDYKEFKKGVSDENRVMCVITVDGTIDVVAM